MESRENPLFGRKVFFVNPSFLIENYVFDFLRKNEYEVYMLQDYKKAKSILAAYPDSICFIDIDAELSYSEWYNYMKSFASIEEIKAAGVERLMEVPSMDRKSAQSVYDFFRK